ncbi:MULTISPECIES: stalk domain-containing protein [unclassified Paenibacillus]|uniref:stalk domain-containing protein n=1 Tax=unclassified Paenibacillus TaxID=185978 RepID=UPI00278B0332|nr:MULTISPECIES: trypsin-like peptidase domain-containing protein [unclassified Paenibacillus]MDQ0896291.1 hypothetical protein [Paenibacillus sp. V4I7]MDQ0913781.1 hypothetical protein [Paenibacillus sp. V4I5]
MKKKIVILISLFYFLLIGSAHASSNIKVYLYDELVDMDNPIIVNGNTLVPLRVLFESLGASVYWDDQSRTIRATKGDTTLLIPVGSNKVSKDGKEITLEEPANIINDKTYVPLRFVSESFNQDVKWDQENNSIHIGKSLGAKEISKLASPAVVYVEVFDNKNTLTASGSGFIIESSGVIVTNYHVINYANSAVVTLTNGKKYAVTKVINYDPEKDIAILKVTPSEKLPTIEVGNSDKLENGEPVFAIGSPKGLQNTISTGIVSNKRRTDGNRTFIQISAEITHGSSGGALLNSKSEVVGITSNGLGEADLNFAIPINEIGVLRHIDKNMTVDSVYNYEHVIQYNDGIYVGDKKNGNPNGLGVIIWNNGHQYSGSWLDGYRSGKGKYTWPNGEIYDGEWVKGLKQGFGNHKDAFGNIYEGQFSNDLANGKGLLTFSNGDKYLGDFTNAKFNGYGTFTFSNGQVTQGYWVDGSIVSSPTSNGTPRTGSSLTPPVTTKTLSIYSNDGKTYLGKLTTNVYDVDSIFNSYGTYGNKYSTDSIWNEFGSYGSKFSSTSAFNEFAFEPPVIIDEKGSIVGRLTINSTITGAISPVGLKEALKTLGY